MSLLTDRTHDAGSGLVPDLDEVHGDYRVSFARSAEERDGVFRLRFDVFNLELGEGFEESHDTGRDLDEYDDQCQHLVVRDARTDAIVGTYRMQVPEVALAGSGLYSATEFDLSRLPAQLLASSVELGRACIAREHRNRKLLFLLWRGLAAYLLWHKRRYFFGCSSLTSQDPMDGVWFTRYLREHDHLHRELSVLPRPGFECIAGGDVEAHPPVEVPKLFGIYLRYGAKLLGPPAIDRRFKTIDYFMLLDIHAIDPATFRSFAE